MDCNGPTKSEKKNTKNTHTHNNLKKTQFVVVLLGSLLLIFFHGFSTFFERRRDSALPLFSLTALHIELHVTKYRAKYQQQTKHTHN